MHQTLKKTRLKNLHCCRLCHFWYFVKWGRQDPSPIFHHEHRWSSRISRKCISQKECQPWLSSQLRRISWKIPLLNSKLELCKWGLCKVSCEFWRQPAQVLSVPYVEWESHVKSYWGWLNTGWATLHGADQSHGHWTHITKLSSGEIMSVMPAMSTTLLRTRDWKDKNCTYMSCLELNLVHVIGQRDSRTSSCQH